MATASSLTFTAFSTKAGHALNAVQVTSATHIRTRRNRHEVANPGDYIVRDPDGALRVVREATFEAEMEATATPSNPTSVASSAQTTTTITLTWTDAVVADSVNIYRDGVLVANVDDAVETYEDTGLEPDTEYSYVLKTVKTEQESTGTTPLVQSTDAA